MKPTSNAEAAVTAKEPRLDGVRILVLFGAARLFGQERGNIEALRNLAEIGAKVRFITSSRCGAAEIQPELDAWGFEWTSAQFGHSWHSYLLTRRFFYLVPNLMGVVAVSFKLWREILRWQPTHLYCMNWQYFLYALPALTVCRRIPLIWRAGDAPPTHTKVHRWMLRTLFRRVAQMVCISHFIKRSHEAAGMSPAKLRVIYSHPPVRSPKCQSVPAPHPIKPKDALAVVFIGQVARIKGADLLVEAIGDLVSRGRNVCLWMAGTTDWDDAFARQLSAQITALGLEERVQRLGFVSDVSTLLAQADIHAAPSVCREALGNVVLEAKQQGVPSVVFPDGGLPELIEHQADGFICRDCTVPGLAEGLDFFATNPAARQRCGITARESLPRKFGLTRFRRQWAEVFASTNVPAT